MLSRNSGLGSKFHQARKTLPHRTLTASLLPLTTTTATTTTTTTTTLRRHYALPSQPENPPSHEIAILGGGITGLASAYYLTQQLPEARITIFEAGDRIGGWLSSKRVEVEGGSVLFEAGPRTLRHNGNGALAGRLIQELGIAKDTIFTQKSAPAATNRFLFYPDRLLKMPHPAHGLLPNLANLLTTPPLRRLPFALLTEHFRSAPDPFPEDESVGAFFSRRLGEESVAQLLSGVMHGIHAGDVWKLSAKSLFPVQWRGEREEGSIMAGFARGQNEGMLVTKSEGTFLREMSLTKWEKGLREVMVLNSVFTWPEGLGFLVDRIYERLFASGKVEFRRNTPVENLALERHEHGTSVKVSTKGPDGQQGQRHDYFSDVISALSPAQLNATTSIPITPPIPAVTVMTVNLYFRSPGLHPAGFGYLIPAATTFDQNPERALGVVFDTSYSPDKDAECFGKFGMTADGFRNFDPRTPIPCQDDLPPGRRGSKVTVMLGGHWWDGWPAFPSEAEGLDMARSVLERHLGVREEPEAWMVNLQRDCIPQYHVGHEGRLKTAHGNLVSLFEGKVKVAGNWTKGVGVNDCLRSAWDAVEAVKEGGLGRTGLEGVGREEMVRLQVKSA